MMNRKYFLQLVALLSLLISVPAITQQAFAQDLAEGEKLFKQNCAACHKVQGKLIGPQLAGVQEKYANDMEWLYKWVKNAPALIQSGDEKAVALYEQYNKAQMNAFPTLTNTNIDNILAWVEAENEAINNPPEEETATAAAGGGESIDTGLYYALLAMVGVLVLIALILVIITATLITAVRTKEEAEPFSLSEVIARTRGLLQNKFVVTAITAFVLVGGTAKWVAEARTIGLHEGYMPEQPIKFSHKIHAGQYQIDCEYCHSGVTKSKNAWIPSVNVCMNCHKAIQEGAQYGAEEIAKIYEASGFDPTVMEYTGEEKPIEWVRIHNLPDHAYFNHAQHVVVGQIECETCHGPVEEMEVVYQYADLGMGWCINCHRTEKVKDLGQETDMTVEDMGGLNCARCHY